MKSSPYHHAILVLSKWQNWQKTLWSDFVAQAGDIIGRSCDLEAIMACFGPLSDSYDAQPKSAIAPPPAQHITVIRDEAFGFAYQHQLEIGDAKARNILYQP